MPVKNNQRKKQKTKDLLDNTMSGSSVLCGIQSFLSYGSPQHRSKVWIRVKTQRETSYPEDTKKTGELFCFANQQKCEIHCADGQKIYNC